MKRLVSAVRLVSLVSISALVTAGCASTASRAPQPAPQPASPSHSGPAHSDPAHSDPAPPAAAPAIGGPPVGGPPIGGPPVRSVEVPVTAGPGKPRETKVLVDEPALKLVRIVLRAGTLLPEHHAEVPVLIQALHGSGVVTAGGEQLRLDTTHVLVLAAKVPHAVAPEPGTDLVLLVHHLGRPSHHHGEGAH